MRHGLVIGKFYPPHDGHHLLVRAAAAACDRVTVLVLFHSVESIPLELRVDWLSEVHRDDANVTVHGVVDDHPVDFGDPAVWDLHEAAFRAGLAEVTDEPVTAVFSSEDYGAELARRFGAEAVEVDAARGTVDISGTRLRADPVAHWEQMREPVRGYLAMRVLVPDGDGSLPVARSLVEAMRARGGAHRLTRLITSPDEEELAARTGGPVLVCVGDRFEETSALRLPDAGDRAGRVTAALAAIDRLLDEGWGIADPEMPRSDAGS